MFKNTKAYSGFSVNDIQKAKQFYSRTLGAGSFRNEWCAIPGKYHGSGPSEPGRMSQDMLKEFMPEKQRADRIVSAVKTVSDQAGRSMAQVSLAWLPAVCETGLLLRSDMSQHRRFPVRLACLAT